MTGFDDVSWDGFSDVSMTASGLAPRTFKTKLGEP
jgi:hypothetical protein